MPQLTSCFIGIGANLAPDGFASPQEGLVAAIDWLAERGQQIVARSSWYRSAPVPVSDQPDFINAVLHLSSPLAAHDLLALLNEAEAAFGRVRHRRNEARVLDLDIIDFGGQIIATDRLSCPHPRAALRAFVLLPLAEIAPDWVHPLTGEKIARLIDQLPADQQISRLAGGGAA